MNFLDRESAPLSATEWELLDAEVVKAAREVMIGRRVLDVLGPLGSGVYSLPYSYYGSSKPSIDVTGEKSDLLEAEGRRTVTLPMIYQDFKLLWRDMEADHRLGTPVDISMAALAANAVALKEDDLIFNGSKELEVEGLLNATGRQKMKISSWAENGSALADVVKAKSLLTNAGHYGAAALVVSSSLYGHLVRQYGVTGMLELDQVKALVGGGVFYSNMIAGNKAVLISNRAPNVQLAIGQDMITAYTEATAMNHIFRVMETVALLIRRADAIVTIE